MTLRAVVVGAGPAGAHCAERMASRGANVTLIGAEPALPYNRVALSKLLAGDIAEAELITHDHHRLVALGIDFRPATRIAAIDRAAQAVRDDDGCAIGYDRLVLAVGAQGFRLPLPGADLPGVLMYRSLADVRAMLAAAEGSGAAVVIGGGLLGLEAAAGLARRGMRVTVVHAVDRLMERQLDAAAASLLARRLAAEGIDLAMPASTVAIEGTARVAGVRLSDGRLIAASLVVMAVGIRPETTLARAAGLQVGRGIVVDDAMLTSDPAILAIGECAEHDGQCCGLVAPALAQAGIAARTALGEAARYTPTADSAALKVAGVGVWSAGETEPAGGEAIVYHDPEAGEYRKFLLRGARLVGAMLYGDTADAPWYHRLIATAAPIEGLRSALPFGVAYAPRDADGGER
jgi:nitrite reductase (NADH) large subunit